MRVEELVAPRSRTEIIEDDPDALFVSPYMTGDVFADVPDLDDPERTITVAIVGHPCVIRGSGGRLATRVPCCLVGTHGNPISYAEWPERQFDLFPLGALGADVPVAVRLAEFRPVHRRELTRARRVAALTPRGVYVFQQRFTHSLTRVAFKLAAFEEGSKHVVREAELEADWIGQLVGACRDEAMIARHVRAFHEFLDANVDGEPRRAALGREGGQATVRRELREELERLSCG